MIVSINNTPVHHEPTGATVLDRAALVDGLKQGLLLGLMAATLLVAPVPILQGGARRPDLQAFAAAPANMLQSAPRFADLAGERASPDVRYIADWVVDSRDNGTMSFVILDKRNAKVFVFEPSGTLRGASTVLLGAAKGDDSVAGIGLRPISEVRPEERTTPSGRFVAEPGRNASGEDVVWVDYDAAVSMHRVRTMQASERRLERLQSPSVAEHRISYGCINLPVAFFDKVVGPTFTGVRGVVYVLPEVKPLGDVFPAYDVAERHRSKLGG